MGVVNTSFSWGSTWLNQIETLKKVMRFFLWNDNKNKYGSTLQIITFNVVQYTFVGVQHGSTMTTISQSPYNLSNNSCTNNCYKVGQASPTLICIRPFSRISTIAIVVTNQLTVPILAAQYRKWHLITIGYR
jgi:hypothetical protein